MRRTRLKAGSLAVVCPKQTSWVYIQLWAGDIVEVKGFDKPYVIVFTNRQLPGRDRYEQSHMTLRRDELEALV